MQFSTNCPACGASLSLTNTSRHITCTFCGRDFDVDLSEASPDLKPGPGLPKEYNPPLEPEDPPSLPAFEPAASPAIQTPPPTEESQVAPPKPEYARFEPPAQVKKVTQRIGKWLWVLVIFLVLLCVSCVAGAAILINWMIQSV